MDNAKEKMNIDEDEEMESEEDLCATDGDSDYKKTELTKKPKGKFQKK